MQNKLEQELKCHLSQRDNPWYSTSTVRKPTGIWGLCKQKVPLKKLNLYRNCQSHLKGTSICKRIGQNITAVDLTLTLMPIGVIKIVTKTWKRLNFSI